MLTVSVSEAKAKFLELIRQAQNDESIVVQKNGAPVAAILPYKDYVNLERVKAYIAMQELSRVTKESGVTAQEVYQESRRQLERR